MINLYTILLYTLVLCFRYEYVKKKYIFKIIIFDMKYDFNDFIVLSILSKGISTRFNRDL